MFSRARSPWRCRTCPSVSCARAVSPTGHPARPAHCALTTCRINVFEKRYVLVLVSRHPARSAATSAKSKATPFLGDPDAILKVLLPIDPRFDLAVNVFTFQPGAALPLVEMHMMEHGLLMLEGRGSIASTTTGTRSGKAT